MLKFFFLFLWVHSALFSSPIFLQDAVKRDLELTATPIECPKPDENGVLDVAIIGGGHSGSSLAFTLRRYRIFNVIVFDENEEGFEGPWLTTARMQTLRSGKEIPGPSMGMPNLTFRAWYEAQYQDWNTLDKIPIPLWAHYLHWYKKVLDLPVKNKMCLQALHWNGSNFSLLFENGQEINARKVVFATGRDGCGGFHIPHYMLEVPKTVWFHTGEIIPKERFFNQRVCIIGASASAFDAAAVACESGAKKVTMLMRRDILPNENVLSKFLFWPAFYSLPDEDKIKVFKKAWTKGTTAPQESIDRLKNWSIFHLQSSTWVEKISLEKDQIHLKTNKGYMECDLIICATGYEVNIHKVAELSSFADDILLWKDLFDGLSEKMGAFPYLGPYFEFLEKKAGRAPFLKDLHCFNYGAFLSHGRVAGDIDQMITGIRRLAEGIKTSFFLEAFSNTFVEP